MSSKKKKNLHIRILILEGIQRKNIIRLDKDILLIGRQMMGQWSEKFSINRRIPAMQGFRMLKNLKKYSSRNTVKGSPFKVVYWRKKKKG